MEFADRVHSTSQEEEEEMLMEAYGPRTERRAPPRVYSANRLRQREWQQIRNRWQLRKYDFQQEDDVGHAMAIQIQQSRTLLAASLNQQQKKRPSRTTRGENSSPADNLPP